MSLVPKNSIIENQYTLGGELSLSLTGKPYQGYYCIVENKYYTGKTYTSDSVELVKKSLVTRTSNTFNSIPSSIGKFDKRYFAKKINVNPILIREINEQTYSNLVTDPFYQTIIIEGTEIYPGSPVLDQANQQMPGLKAFLVG